MVTAHNGDVISRRLAVLSAALLLAGACSSGPTSSDDGAPGDGAAATAQQSDLQGDDGAPSGPDATIVGPLDLPVPEGCDVVAVAREAAWPFVVPQEVVPTSYTVDEADPGELDAGIADLDGADVAADGSADDPVGDEADVAVRTAFTYRFTGVTNDPEVALVAAMEGSFPGFVVGEPDGAASGVIVAFDGPEATAVATIVDDDDDGCWDVELSATYASQPPLIADGTVLGDDGVVVGPSDGVDAGDLADGDGQVTDPLDELAAAGTGELIGGRGSAQLVVTTCRIAAADDEALRIEAVADEGLLLVEGASGELLRAVDLRRRCRRGRRSGHGPPAGRRCDRAGGRRSRSRRTREPADRCRLSRRR